jgi:hypothetical protein
LGGWRISGAGFRSADALDGMKQRTVDQLGPNEVGWVRQLAPVVFSLNNECVDHRKEAIIVAVPTDAVGELEREGLAFALPVLRGPVVDALVMVGTDAASLVTLLQAPNAVWAFAGWLRARCARSGDSIEVSARSGDLRVHLKVDGHVDVSVIADFLTTALRDTGS